MYRRGGHTIFQTSRTAHGLEISNAAPTSGDCDPDCKGKSASDFGACGHGCAGCKMLAARLAQNLQIGVILALGQRSTAAW
jgi:hypothetical protein